MNLGTAQVIQGNALALPLPDNSVDLICTSPPYFGLRSYQDAGEHYDGQIGSEATPAEFLDALLAATREMVRVLKPSGSIFVNLGDKYAGIQNQRSRRTTQPVHNNSDYGPHRRETDWDKAIPQNVNFGGIRDKSLMGIPWRYAIACIDQLGLILRAEIIWAKPNGLPESVTDRVRRSHETWFHFTRSPRYFSAVDEIREPSTTAATDKRSDPSHYERLLGGRWLPSDADVEIAGNTQKNNKAYNPLGKLPGSVWTVPTQPLTVPPELGVDHFAAYPMEWPRRIILGWTPNGICVECGQGRRPISQQTDEAYAAERARVRTRRADQNTDREAALYTGGRTNTGGFSKIANGVVKPAYTVVGYICACTPYTDHPGTGEDNGAHATPSQPRTGNMGGGNGTALNTRPRTGPWREYHFDQWTPAPTTPAVVLDPFGGTGTTALVAKALGRIGITVDLSADYCRLAEWRCNDPRELAAALQVERPVPVHPDQLDLFSESP